MSTMISTTTTTTPSPSPSKDQAHLDDNLYLISSTTTTTNDPTHHHLHLLPSPSHLPQTLLIHPSSHPPSSSSSRSTPSSHPTISNKPTSIAPHPHLNPPPPLSLTPSNPSRNRASSWSIFRRNSLPEHHPAPSPTTPGLLHRLTKNSSHDSPPTTAPVSDPSSTRSFRPTHSYSSSASFSLSSIASALKRPLNLNLGTPPPSATRRLSPLPSPSPQSPGESGLTQELASGHATDPDPTPSVPPPRLVVESPSQESASIPFDFNLFLDQIRWPQAEPIAKYLRSFLKEFNKRANHPTHQTSVLEQVKVINDFLDFISLKMREIPDGPWDPRTCSDAEFDNAVEAMEKLVMNRVWHLTFTPALTTPSVLQTDDVERDTVLSQKMNLFGWLTDRHLDLSLPADEADGFLEFAKTELLKINSYKAPRDKMICILNCCKVIFGLIRHIDQTEAGADTFIPILILVVLRAQPQNLISNVQFIQRFRNPDKMQGENGYYLSSLSAAISFIERLEHSVLSNITQSEFEFNVEEAIGRLPRSPPESPDASIPINLSSNPPPISKSETNHPITVPSSSPSIPDLTRSWLFTTVPQLAEKAVSKPLNAIARIVDDLASESEEMNPHRRSSLDYRRASSSNLGEYHQHHPHHPDLDRRGNRRMRPRSADLPRSDPHSPTHETSSPTDHDDQHSGSKPEADSTSPTGGSNEFLDPKDFKRIESLKRAEHLAKLETLGSIFPTLEPEVLEIVLITHDGVISKAIDSLLEMS